MTSPPSGRSRRWLSMAAPSAAVFAVLVLTAGVVGASGTRPSAPTAYPTFAWSNGEVLCETDASQPSATVTAAGEAGAGMQMGVGNLSQDNLLGVAGATADLSSATWVATNISDADAYGVTYTASVPVIETALLSLIGLQVGTVSVAVTISMEEYAAGGPVPADAYVVSLELNISGWPWIATLGAGPLVANLSIAPADASVVHLAAGTGNATVVALNASDATMAYLTMGASANVTSSRGATSAVAVLGELLSIGASAGVVAVNFTSAADGASSMNYTSGVVVEPDEVVTIPPTIQVPGAPPIPTVDFLAVGAAAVLASLAIAGGARRARRATSDLEYVTEEENA